MQRDETARPVILGAGGMLGRMLAEVLGTTYPQTVCATRDEIDITDYWATRWDLERLEATVVVNCAAFTDVDGSETRTEHALSVNGTGAGNVARACREIGSRVIHISTDFVFDGAQDRPYREDDPVNPLSAYGRSKLAGEEAVAAENEDHVILRVSWLYGPHGRNFISAILDASANRRPLRIVDDQRGTPTYTADLAEAIHRILGIDLRGRLHFANSGVCSRLEFAREALRLAGLSQVPVEAIRSADLDRPAPRPLYSALDTARYERLTGHHPRPWKETLPDYLEATG